MTEGATLVAVEPETAVVDRARRAVAERAVVREIAVGGLAGLVAGIVVGGIGGRIVMRLAALLAPDAEGRFTENGNRIGSITVEGTMALVVFGGLAFGIFAASVWVVARPWLPRQLPLRAAAAAVLALGALGLGLVQSSNPDFRILGFDPTIVASLLVLVAIGGLALAVIDAVLDRVLPRPDEGRSLATAVYLVILVLGLTFTLIMTVPAFLGSSTPAIGAALLAAGLGTLLAWADRLDAGIDRRLTALAPWLGRGGLLVATAVGLAALAGQVATILSLG